MKKSTGVLWVIVSILLPILQLEALSQNLIEKGVYAGKADTKNINGLGKNISSDLFGGSMNFHYPFLFPEGVRQMTPNFSILYSSKNSDAFSPYGYGFSLSLPKIQRSVKKGVSDLYIGDEYTAYGNDLIPTGSGFFRSKDGTDMNMYILSGNTWIVKTSNGRELLFGNSKDAIIVDPENKNNIFAWYLEEERDAFDNKISYSYQLDGGQPLLRSIQYGYDALGNSLYQLVFSYKTKTASLISYRTQFPIETKSLLERITLQVSNDARKRGYEFTYDSSDSPVSHLIKIQEFSEGEKLPPIIFNYGVGQYTHFITQIENSIGGKMNFEYAPSTYYRDDAGELNNKKIPFIIQTLIKKISEDTVTGLKNIENYTYENAHYYFNESDIWGREYVGFGKVTHTDVKTKTVNYFHQSQTSDEMPGEYNDDIAKKGKIYKTEVYEISDGSFLRSEYTRYDMRIMFGERKLIYPEYKIQSSYYGNEHVDTAVRFSYDNFGNILEETYLGWVNADPAKGNYLDISGDTKTIQREYASNSGANLYGFISSEKMFGWGGELLSKKSYSYDDSMSGEVIFGLLTKKESVDTLGTGFLREQYVYNSKGLLVEKYDFGNNKTTLSYDDWGLAPIVTKNPLFWSTITQYDYFHGKNTSTSDPNSVTTSIVFDPWGRVSKVIRNDGVIDQLLSETNYSDITIPNSVEEVVYFNSGLTNKKTNLRYSDGFGRNLASLSSTEIPNQWIRKDMRYDEVGNTIFVSYPYFTDTYGFTNMGYPFGQTNGEKFRIIAPGVSYSFDAINRILVQQDSLGITRKEYFPKKEKTVNALGKVIDVETNAYGNIITVREFLESIPKVTSYRYDAQGNMVGFTDALGNIRSWLYDGYGRLTLAEDLHKLDDTTYGIRKYVYNSHNQVMKYTHPSGLSMHYTYDTIGRLKGETGSGLLRTYIYDEGVQSLGTLSLVSDSDSTVSYKYDAIGRKISEKRIIGDQSYDIFYSYNLQNQPTSIVYPDGGVVEYSYLNGYTDFINYKSHSGVTYEVVKDITYSPNGAIRSQKYANGMTKIADRDGGYNYRLNKVTVTSGSTIFLDTSYKYDAINNINMITVDGISPIKKNITYNYDDISRLKNAQYNYSDAGYNRDQAQSYSYNYDDIGNTVSSSVIGNYHYGETEYANPHAVTEIGDVNYEYDTAGNIIAQTDSGSSTNFAYSLYGEMLSSEKLGLLTTYSYDYTKRRLVKMGSGFIEHHVIDGYEVEYENLPLTDSQFQSLSNSGISTDNASFETIEVADTGGTGSTQGSPIVDGIYYSVSNFTGSNPKMLITRLTHIMLGSERIATFQSQIEDQEFIQYDDQLIFHVSDYLNSSSLDFSLTGALLQVTDYQPFGQINTYQVTNERVLGMKGGYKNKYLFANKQQDDETDLQYFEKRYYNPKIGKFTTEDSVFWEVGITKRPNQYVLDPDQWNTYSYVRNNPINLVDPTGEEVDYSGTHKDSITGNMYYSVTNLTTQDLDNHYKSNNGTSLQVNFSEINTNFIAPTSFTEVSEKILNGKDGEYNILTKQNFTMKDYNAYERFGTIGLVLDGKLKIQDNAWSFEGSYKSYDDVYDFTVNPTDIKTFGRTLRNILTIGKSITLGKGTPYDIQIRGEKEISGNGKIKNTIPQGRGGQDKKKIIITND